MISPFDKNAPPIARNEVEIRGGKYYHVTSFTYFSKTNLLKKSEFYRWLYYAEKDRFVE